MTFDETIEEWGLVAGQSCAAFSPDGATAVTLYEDVLRVNGPIQRVPMPVLARLVANSATWARHLLSLAEAR